MMDIEVVFLVPRNRRGFVGAPGGGTRRYLGQGDESLQSAKCVREIPTMLLHASSEVGISILIRGSVVWEIIESVVECASTDEQLLVFSPRLGRRVHT